jgi:hypothetical protein
MVRSGAIMSRPIFHALFLFFVTAKVTAQLLSDVRCASLPGGCDSGNTFEPALYKAIQRFEGNKLYGGGKEPIVFASALVDGALAQVSYSCIDGSIPPKMDGASIWEG